MLTLPTCSRAAGISEVTIRLNEGEFTVPLSEALDAFDELAPGEVFEVVSITPVAGAATDRPAYADLDTHWYACRCCGARSWDSDIAALAGAPLTPDAFVPHDEFCPGNAFRDKYVRRVTVL